MLDEVSVRLLQTIRDIVGPDAVDVGLDLPVLLEHQMFAETSPQEILHGIQQAWNYGFVRIVKHSEDLEKGCLGYKGLREVQTVFILRAGQEYLDEVPEKL
ncbi:hypothetical protein J7426_12455 [Tropicibacter sp. R16_0]|uniref:hypothetical protein n=1 Tax=Tropicibacter sp. R16_0 TaxID=2821102 RepID=UPI001ADCBA9E|nr:hypothetical protein [Tropicibacter sp. R16_0]MBO9451076.1 hypothetical protein [Tropicibacter sp. R16_0]